MKFPQKRNAAKTQRAVPIPVTNATRTPWDTRGFSAIASAILPPDYILSIVLIGDTRARTLNRTYRKKDTPANVLSFPLSHTTGEIFINVARVQREARQYDLSPQGYAQFLLIHGCLHLIGEDHGSRMEQSEKRFLAKFSVR